MNKRKTYKELAQEYNTYPELIRSRVKKLERKLNKKLTVKENGITKVKIEAEKLLKKDIKEHPIKSRGKYQKPAKQNSPTDKIVVSNVSEYEHKQFGKIRVVMIDGEPWFMGVDVAIALGYKNPRKAIRDHVDERDKKIIQTEQNVPPEKSIPNNGAIFINESGLYSLVMASKLESARKFQYWVTSEVLPQIRQTGSYNGYQIMPQFNQAFIDQITRLVDANIEAINKIANERDTAIDQRDKAYSDRDEAYLDRDITTSEYEERNEELEEKSVKDDNIIDYQDEFINKLLAELETYDYLSNYEGLYTISIIAKLFGLRSGKVLNDYLKEWKIIYKDPTTNTYALYAQYVEEGLAELKLDKERKSGHPYFILLWTIKGIKFIYGLLKQHEVL